MGIASAIGRALHRGGSGRGGDDPSPPADRTLTREYWDEAAAAPDDETINAICDGCGPREFGEQAASRLPLYGDLHGGMAVLDLCCGMGRTCRHVAPLVREYHGVDFAEGMVAKAREYNAGVPNASFHVNDGLTLGGFADGTFDLVYCELAYQHMPKGTQAAYTSEVLRVLRSGGLFFAQLPRAEFYEGAEYALTSGEIRGLLSGFASAGGSVDKSGQYWMARAVKGGS